jgi:DNA-binding PadR family transcriptional regulator
LARLIQPAVLTVLAGGARHGYRIVERLAASPVMGGNRPDPTGVYRVLRSMERRGLVASSWDLSDAGPARRLYRLTPAGRRCLGRWVATLAEYHRAIQRLLAAARKASAAPIRHAKRREGKTP